MDALIADLLALAQEGAKAMEPEPVELASIAEACRDTVATRDATLTVDTDRTVQADRDRLQQVFENLIRNAVEHGGDAVTITIGDLDDGFYLADDGEGIPKEDREEVFEAGYSTAADGTGFGLRIVEQIVEAHGWEITVAESQSGGTKFEITGVADSGR